MRVAVLRAFADNYIFRLLDGSAPEAAVVDPGDPGPVLSYVERTGHRLTAILNTHHHHDHVGGNRALLERFPGVPVFAGAGDRGRIPGQTAFLKEDDEILVSSVKARVLELPGHTKAHVGYFSMPATA